MSYRRQVVYKFSIVYNKKIRYINVIGCIDDIELH